MSENDETQTSNPPKEETDQTTSTTPSTETTKPNSESPSSESPSLLNQTEGEEGSEGAGDAEGADSDFTPLTQEDITLPEGLSADEELMGSFLEIANESQLSKESVQKLVDLQASAMQKASESISQSWNEMQEQWRSEVQKLPEFGGDNLPKTTAHISRLIEAYAGTAEEQKALRQVFDFTGAGNNPQMIAFLGRVAKELVSEGAPVTGAPSNSRGAGSLAERMFPDNPATGRG